MKPGEHPEFFRFPAPEGRSRESKIRLDGEGKFFDNGGYVEHAKLQQALHTWIGRHPDDGRYILTNGYDWTYFTVDDVPFFVRAIREVDGDAVLVLSDETEEPLDPKTVTTGERGELYLEIQHPSADKAKAGPFRAKLTRHAQTQLGPFLDQRDERVILRTRRGEIALESR
jgi:hypothetical protein